jgi:hypothetical protein
MDAGTVVPKGGTGTLRFLNSLAQGALFARVKIDASVAIAFGSGTISFRRFFVMRCTPARYVRNDPSSTAL